MKVCIVQCKSVLNKDSNVEYARKSMFKAKTKGCDLIVFPELFLTGYLLKERAKDFAETISGSYINKMKTLCKENDITCIFGFPRKDKKKVYNSSCVIDKNGKVVGFYDKTHLFGDEKLYFSAGEELKVFDTSLGKIGVLVCYDIEFPEPSRILTLKGADIICCIAANMKPYNKLHKMFIKTRAIENTTPIIYCNYVNRDEDFEYVGESNIVDVDGNYLINSSKKNKLLYSCLDVSTRVKDYNMNYIRNRRIDIY